MTAREVLALAALRFRYDAATGLLHWLPRVGASLEVRRWNTRYADRVAGALQSNGYVKIGVLVAGRRWCVLAHRVVWFMTHGHPPVHEIDHLDGDRTNNRLANLRDVSHAVNCASRASRIGIPRRTRVYEPAWHSRATQP